MATSDDVRINIIADTKQAISNMAKFAAGIGAAIVVGKKLIQIGADMVNAYGKQEQAEARLATAIKSTGREAEINQKSLSKLASQLQSVTTYGDEATISAMAMVQQLSNLSQEGLKQVTPAMLDFAAAMGVDLQTAASLIGKTLGSSTNALSRYGIEIDATATPTEKLAQLTEALNEKFGGTAEALGETFFGKTTRLKNAIGDIAESGGLLIAQFLDPAVTALTDFATASGTALAEWVELRNAQHAIDTGENTLADEILIAQNALTKLAEEYDKKKTKLTELEDWLTSQGQIPEYTASWMDLAEEVAQLGVKVENAEYNLKSLEGQFEIESDAAAAAAAQTREYNAALTEAAVLVERYKGKFLPEELTEEQEISAAITKLGDLRDTIRDMGGDYSELQQVINALDKKLRELMKPEEYVSGTTESVYASTGVFGDFNIVLDSTVTYLAQYVPLLQAALIANQQNTDETDDYAKALISVNDQLDIYYDRVQNARIESGEMNEHLEKQKDLYEQIAASALPLFEAMGASIVDASKGWEAFREAAKDAIVAVLTGLAKQKAVEAIAALTNPLTAAAAPGLFAAAAAAAVGAGFVAALGEGGIVNRPTMALIGEKGPEAVVPLGRGGMGGVNMQVNVYGNLLTERQLVDGVLRRAAVLGRTH